MKYHSACVCVSFSLSSQTNKSIFGCNFFPFTSFQTSFLLFCLTITSTKRPIFSIGWKKSCVHFGGEGGVVWNELGRVYKVRIHFVFVCVSSKWQVPNGTQYSILLLPMMHALREVFQMELDILTNMHAHILMVDYWDTNIKSDSEGEREREIEYEISRQ